MIAQPVEAPRSLRVVADAPPPADLARGFASFDSAESSRTRLIGRERELALLTALVDNAPKTGAALLIRGAQGAGKSALMGALVADLTGRPVAVLRASGIRAEANLPYAGLHQLLRPVLGELGSLPRPQRRAIQAAFGMAASPAPDPFLIAIATLDLLSMAARPSLVIVVEDAQWLDRRTSEVLSFVARRLSSDRIVLLVTTRDDRRCPILDAGLAELHLDEPSDEERLFPRVAPGIAEPVPERLTDIAAGPARAEALAQGPGGSGVPGPLPDVVATERLDDLERAPRQLKQAWNDIHLGHWTEAASELADATELAREPGQVLWSAVADVAGALLAAMRGDEDQIERTLVRVGPVAIGRPNGWVASTVEVVRAIYELIAARPDAAYTRLHDRLAFSEDASLWAIDYFADAAVLSGNVDEGRAVLDASGSEVAARRGPLHVAAHLYASAVLADEPTADERQGLAIDNLAGWPIHQARLQLHRGAWLRRHRRAADSRVPLRAARDLFEAVGAAPLAERARRELRASGERIRRREITEWDRLSPQESEIAHLAAEGHSNREIGDQLFLSHRTVGAHLYRIFPKLGVTSRGQLHSVLAAGAGDVTVARP
jgi:DNA-binding CsgD family transcriptional regulator